MSLNRSTRSRVQKSLVALKRTAAAPVEPLEDRRLLAATPTLLADIKPGELGSTPSYYPAFLPNNAFAKTNDRLVFLADEGNREQALWATDGTPGGTQRLLDLSPPGTWARVGDVQTMNGVAYFFVGIGIGNVDQRLIRSDGTPEGTREVAAIRFFQSDFGPTEEPAVAAGGALYYINNPVGATSWSVSRSDGTAEGTRLVRNFDRAVSNLTVVNDTVFFTVGANRFSGPNELWKTDGTEAGTVLVKRFAGGEGEGVAADYLSDVGGTLFLRAQDGQGHGQIWKSDGTEAGTVLVRQFTTLSLPSPSGHNFDPRIVDLGGQALFVGTDVAGELPHGAELWKSDGTAEGTVRVKDIVGFGSGSDPAELTVVRDTLYFSANVSGTGRELWKSDGTEAGTAMVAELAPGSASSDPTIWGAVGGDDGLVYFTAYPGVLDPTGGTLYATDGTAAGTEAVTAPGFGDVALPTAVGDRLVFRAKTADVGSEPRAIALERRPARVIDRHVFYNDSAFDGGDPAANTADDAAVPPEKAALLPGRAASFANVTTYARGLNGVTVDVTGLHDRAALDAADFEFQTAASPNAPQWSPAPVPTSVTVRPGAGTGGSDRVTLTWGENAVRNAWLRVTVKATVHTGLAQEDVFSFGNLIGDTGDATGAPLRVNSVDLGAVKRALNSASSITGRYDFNRDDRVNALDLGIVKANLNRSLSMSAAASVAASIPSPGAGDNAAVEHAWDETKGELLS